MVNLSLDICMENFWTRPTGVYAKPVWLREGVLQIIFDDDNTPLRYHSGSTVPGGHAAFTRTAVVYSSKPTADYSPEIADEALASEVAALKAACPAFTQRVGSCYLIEANLFGFVNAAAGESSRMEEMNVLSTAMTWAVRDYTARYGVRPDHIVLHLDVNGTLILGDVASQKSITKAANSLAKRAIERAEQGAYTLPCKVEDVERIKTLPEALVCEEFNVMYAEKDLIRTLHHCLAALAVNPSGGANACLTLAIRTNGVESAAAATFLQSIIKDALGQELTDEGGTIGRYVVAHEDPAAGVYLHPVLLEKLHKSKSYSLAHYVDELHAVCGRTVELAALAKVCAGSMKKSDPKFKVYLGLCDDADATPLDYAISPPCLTPVFASEAWHLPENVDDYKRVDSPATPLSARTAYAHATGPWWSGFSTEERPHAAPSSASWLRSASVELLSVVTSRLRALTTLVSSSERSASAAVPPKRRRTVTVRALS